MKKLIVATVVALAAAVALFLAPAPASAQTVVGGVSYSTYTSSQETELVYDPGAAVTNTAISVTLDTSAMDWMQYTLSNPSGASRTLVVSCLDSGGNVIFQQASVSAGSASNSEVLVDPAVLNTLATGASMPSGLTLVTDHPCQKTQLSVAQAASAPTLKAHGRSRVH